MEVKSQRSNKVTLSYRKGLLMEGMQFPAKKCTFASSVLVNRDFLFAVQNT